MSKQAQLNSWPSVDEEESKWYGEVRLKAIALLLVVLNPTLGWHGTAMGRLAGCVVGNLNVCTGSHSEVLMKMKSKTAKRSAAKRAAKISKVSPPPDIPLSKEDAAAAADVRRWLDEYIIRHHLCPWASRADEGGGLRIIVSRADTEAGVLVDLKREAKRLVKPPPPPAAPPPALATTLLVCPGVREWAEDFAQFDTFVRGATQDGVSLVAFHPNFARWRAAPPGTHGALAVGESVLTYYWEAFADPKDLAAAQAYADSDGGDIDVPCHYLKSEKCERAVVECIDEDEVGVRNVRVRFEDPVDGDSDDDQEEDAFDDVPIEWLTRDTDAAGVSLDSLPLLADNLIHTSPVPIIHLLQGDELAEEAQRVGGEYIARLQARNARLARRTQRLWQKSVSSSG